MTDEQDKAFLNGLIYASLDSLSNNHDQTVIMKGDDIVLCSPRSGKFWIVTLTELKEPPPQDWVPESMRPRS